MQLQGRGGNGQGGSEAVYSGEQRREHMPEPGDDTCNGRILGLLHSTGTKSLTLCYRLNCAPPNSYVKALTPNVTIFGHGAYTEIIKVK